MEEIKKPTENTEISENTEKKPRKTRKKTPKTGAQQISEHITLDEDGRYRWIYEMGLFKSPVIFWLVYKIFLFIFLAIFAVVTIASLIKGVDQFVKTYPVDLKYMGIGFAVMTAVVSLGYAIYALIMGGKYCVMFELDEKCVIHRQIDSQAKKARKIGAATIAVGALTRNPTMIGAGAASARTAMYTDFSKVKKVKARPRFNVIKIREGFSHNQVYAYKEDFEFVLNYINEHCPNKK